MKSVINEFTFIPISPQPSQTDLQLMEGKIDLLQTKVRDIRGQMRSLDDRSRQIETMTQSLVNHFKVKWEKQEDDVEGED